MGSVKKEIVFLGDTVNTAARIQELCRQTGDRVLASADLIDRLELPPGVAKRSLGDLRLRGKGADLSLYALTKGPFGRADASARREIAREEKACRAFLSTHHDRFGLANAPGQTIVAAASRRISWLRKRAYMPSQNTLIWVGAAASSSSARPLARWFGRTPTSCGRVPAERRSRRAPPSLRARAAPRWPNGRGACDR